MAGQSVHVSFHLRLVVAPEVWHGLAESEARRESVLVRSGSNFGHEIIRKMMINP